MASEIFDKLLVAIKDAMKARDSDTLLALRTLHADIKNCQIDKRREVDDADVASVIAKAIKQRRDSVEQFRAAGRTDLADREQVQIDLYKKYQPRQLNEEQIEALVKDVLKQTGATEKKQIGLVMKELMPQVRGKADGKLVNAVVSRLLP